MDKALHPISSSRGRPLDLAGLDLAQPRTGTDPSDAIRHEMRRADPSLTVFDHLHLQMNGVGAAQLDTLGDRQRQRSRRAGVREQEQGGLSPLNGHRQSSNYPWPTTQAWTEVPTRHAGEIDNEHSEYPRLG